MIYRVVQQTDGPVAGFETVVVEIEVEPGLVAPRHTHPGSNRPMSSPATPT
jgi:quercetin dioxygenase-like cupin family protein